ncbi:ribonuclease III [Dentipellis sp. KUC8613]|nr:ribonuclease III [Dentipellis sp. KUC8613]
MGHAQKRLASTAARLASVPLSSLKSFPPKQATSSEAIFNAEHWSTLQPPPTSAFSALAHRIGLGNAIGPSDLQQACTHPSILPLHAQHRPTDPPPAVNGNLDALGNSLLGLFATEHLNATYPHLPTRALKAAVSAYVGPLTCASVAKEMGAASLLRWHRTPPTSTRPAIMHTDALSSIPRALTALVYQHRSLPTARTFAQSFFLSREVNLRSMLKFRDPKMNLVETVHKFGRERPVSRLLKETGRFSNSPVFVVGIFSGADKLGEGFGSSLKMAEYRAAEDSLHRLYLTQTPPHLVRVPTSTFPLTQGDVFTAGEEGAYVPGELGETEVLLGSAGRSSIVQPKRQSVSEEEVEEL